MAKQTLALVVATLLIASFAWAQDQGGESGDRPGGGGGFGGLLGALDPEMLREQAMLEVQVWHKYLELSDEQVEQVVELVIENRNEMIEMFRAGAGVRPDPSMVEEITLKKALAIFDVLTDEQKGAMNYYYNDIAAEIAESQRSRFQAGGFGGGRNGGTPQEP